MCFNVKKRTRSCIAVSICAALLFGAVGNYAFVYADDPPAAGFETSAQDSATVSLADGITAEFDKSLSYIGDGIYEYTLDATAYYQAHYESVNRDSSRDDYHVIPRDGYYFLELWGGDGKNGGNSIQSSGGTGGDAGHVYGYTYLTAGQVIYSTIGGNGEETVVEDQGGGANGDGGGHGETGSFTVGGGGGYSAIFLFNDETAFRAQYVNADDTLNALSDSDRLTKYMMIAAGGGGGGAGNQLFWKATGTPDGGIGGSVGKSASGQLSGSEYAVAGTYFAGSDGKSSGTKTTYVGHGGTYVPGAAGNTYIAWYEVDQPNDWEGTYNSNHIGGAGGSCNLRGGGGGAGFCGASGGIMASLMLAANVGGGGGSSFISNAINYDITSASTSWINAYLLNTNTLSTTGGAFVVTYMGDDITVPLDLSHLQNASLTLDFNDGTNELFDVVSATATKADGVTANGTAAITGSTVNVSGASLIYESAGTPLKVTVVLKLKSGFAGGNDVPLLGSASLTTQKPLEAAVVTAIPACADTDRCNVPLNFTVSANSYQNTTGTVTYTLAQLFNDTYSVPRAALAGGTNTDYNYNYISSIGGITVWSEDGVTQQTSAVTPAVTTKYTVKLNVVPITGTYAKVGPHQAATDFTAIAAISIVTPGTVTMGDLTMQSVKELSLSGGTYTMTLKLTDLALTNLSMPADFPAQSYSAANGSYAILHDGVYCIQAWGATGGAGGNAQIGTGALEAGGTGGTGGYKSGYVVLSKDDVLTITSGANGTNGADDTSKTGTGQVAVGGGGTAGGSTSVSLSGTALLIAGGGGGGGGGASVTSALGWNNKTATGNNGSSVNNSVTASTVSDTAAGDGGAGTGVSGYLSSGNSATGGAGGTAGKNYRDTSLSDVTDTVTYTQGDYTVTTGGGVRISCVSLNYKDDEKASNAFGISVTEIIDEYFDFSASDVSVYVNGTAAASSAVTVTPNADGTKTLSVSNITSAASDTVSSGSISLASVQISAALTRKTGFIGGNDVPVLKYSGASDTGMSVSRRTDTSQIEQRNETDYANVPLEYDLTGKYSVNDKTIIYGDSFNYSELRSFNPALPSGADAWKADFIESFVSPADATVTPSVTASYSLEAGIRPLAAPAKATVGDAAVKLSAVLSATVYVNYSVTSLLDNMVLTGNSYAVQGEDYTASLVPADGYDYPSAITVTVGGTTLAEGTGYVYNTTTGELDISSLSITDNIVITASGAAKQYKLWFVWADGVGTAAVEAGRTSYDYHAGDSITAAKDFADGKLAEMNLTAPTGYEFKWDWDTADGSPITTMPAYAKWVFGSYTAKAHTLTVNYVDSSSAVLHTAYTAATWYGDTYSVVSPHIDGYVCDTPVVSGTIPDSDVTVNVIYTPAANTLTVFYILADSNTELTADRVSTVYAVGDAYSVTSPAVAGYTPRQAVCSGNMTAQGVTLYVYYDPDTFTVTFNSDGGSCTESSRLVAYNNIYGYDAAADEYKGLPVPVKTGYTFSGWKNSLNTVITEETAVTITADETLTAVWTANSSKLIINYKYADGTEAAPQTTETHAYSEAYSVASPAITGYTPAPLTVSGNMPAANKTVTVVYSINTHTLTINYYHEDSSIAAAQYSQPVNYNATYAVASPTGITFGATPVYPDKATVSGVMPDSDVTVNVTYSQFVTVVDVDLEWGDMQFVFSGRWDPDTGTYLNNSYENNTADSDVITVTNNSTMAIKTTYVYTPLTGQTVGLGFFYDASHTVPIASEVTVAAGTVAGVLNPVVKKVYVLPNAQPILASDGTFHNVGGITVTITTT